MLSNFNGCNIENIKDPIELILKNKFNNLYNYFIKEIKINDEVIKKMFIIDIRSMFDEMIDYIFSDFQTFQHAILSSDFYSYEELQKKKLFIYSYNMDLIFLYDENRKYDIDKNKILHDIEFAFKKFLNESDLKELLSKDYSSLNLNKEKMIELKNRVLKLKAFNYINGNNGSGKTQLLREISKFMLVPIFSMEEYGLNLDQIINNKDNVKKYLYQLTGSYETNEYNSYQRYAYRLAQILEFSKEHNNIVLLDDLRWGSLDDKNELNLIDVLFDYSLNNEGVVITGCKESKIIKRRTYKANIIDL